MIETTTSFAINSKVIQMDISHRIYFHKGEHRDTNFALKKEHKDYKRSAPMLLLHTNNS